MITIGKKVTLQLNNAWWERKLASCHHCEAAVIWRSSPGPPTQHSFIVHSLFEWWLTQLLWDYTAPTNQSMSISSAKKSSKASVYQIKSLPCLASIQCQLAQGEVAVALTPEACLWAKKYVTQALGALIGKPWCPPVWNNAVNLEPDAPASLTVVIKIEVWSC